MTEWGVACAANAPGIVTPLHPVIDDAGVHVTDLAVRSVLACDPGTQTGWCLAILLDGHVTPLCAWLTGSRAVPGTRTRSYAPAAPPTFASHKGVVSMALSELRFAAPRALPPVVVCEDWFAGVNPNTARDVARQFYFVEAAAEACGLTFRPVDNQVWKRSYLGRGGMKSADALAAYAAKGFAAHPGVVRWDRSRGALKQADDAAALGIAHYYLETEVT